MHTIILHFTTFSEFIKEWKKNKKRRVNLHRGSYIMYNIMYEGEFFSVCIFFLDSLEARKCGSGWSTSVGELWFYETTTGFFV